MNENEVFRKVNDITTTRSKWTVSFVIDLQTYSHFIDKAKTDITNAETVAKQLVEHYNRPKEDGFLNNFVGLANELQTLKDIQEMIFKTEYRTLGTQANREKRSLLPIIDQISSFLFGTLSEGDLDEIKSNSRIRLDVKARSPRRTCRAGS